MVSSLVVEIECHGVADKVLSAGLETELFVDVFHAVRIKVDA